MLDERAFIARVEAAAADEFAEIMKGPTAEQEQVLRAYLGDERFQRIHSLALRRSASRRGRAANGNVVVLHGIMGSELAAVDRAGALDSVWVHAVHLIAGRLGRLRLAEDGRSGFDPAYDVRATGIMKRHYGELLLSLAADWNVRAFWYDWRKDIRLAAAELAAQIRGWFGEDSPVHLVAHSMGGLVARAFVKDHRARWERMWDASSRGALGGRLVMLGTPNHGSFTIPQVITGLEGTVRKLARLDLRHDLREVLAILNSFVGSYQMLPSPLVMANVARLYQAQTYGALNVSQAVLDNAFAHHRWMSDAVDFDRMVYVAGNNRPTFSDIREDGPVDRLDAYRITTRGDGRVPHDLGMLRGENGELVSTYVVDETHGGLPCNGEILAALHELLETGKSGVLSTTPATGRMGRADDDESQEALRRHVEEAWGRQEEHIDAFVNRARARSPELTPTMHVSVEERKVEETLTSGFLSTRTDEARLARPQPPFAPARIALALVHGSIHELDALRVNGEPVDAIAVGHYLGVRPQGAELALDRAISRPLAGVRHGGAHELDPSDLLLTQYTDRGIILGELGRPFFLSDPRRPRGRANGAGDRLVALAGMGIPGRFGVPELTVLVRELCWSLARMGKRHLATVLIGAGNGNISPPEAVSAWIRGIKRAVTGSAEDGDRALRRITFVELKAGRLRAIQEAILVEKAALEGRSRLLIEYKEIVEEKLDEYEADAVRMEVRRLSKRRRTPNPARDRQEQAPTRITVGFDGGKYRFGAITESAAVPEREIPLDSTLVIAANDELAGESVPDKQVERGRFMERLLIPDDIRRHLAGDAPVVMMLDSTTARIHWEMVAQGDPLAAQSGEARTGPPGAVVDAESRTFDFAGGFLGTSRGFTRQLRTTFAPPPEPPPPPRRLLRVLIVADPAADNRLPGAEEEGAEVADLFESFNVVYGGLTQSRVEVVRLFGPYEATRTRTLSELVLHSYDVLHFAGHCVYDKNAPERSGWIFTGGARLTANELNRIDRVPKFLFSNACESGITPDRSERRSVDLAPSFAERFLERGVSNFICTAWPVDDTAARLFARRLYESLLGLEKVGNRADRYVATDMRPMHEAMREARLAVGLDPNGARTWGAYQHYGDPYFRFFDWRSSTRSEHAVARKSEPGSRGHRRRPAA